MIQWERRICYCYLFTQITNNISCVKKSKSCIVRKEPIHGTVVKVGLVLLEVSRERRKRVSKCRRYQLNPRHSFSVFICMVGLEWFLLCWYLPDR